MKRILIALTLSLVAACLLLSGCQREEQLTAKECFEKGLSFANSQNYPDAIDAFTKAVEIDPRFAEAHANRAGIWYFQGDYDKAIY